MKRIYSIKGRNLFREVYQKGRKLQDSGIRIFILKSSVVKQEMPDRVRDASGESRNIKIAVVLTKSFGKAHTRNKARRRVRAICSQLFNDMQNGFCIIIRIDNEFKNKQFNEEKRIISSLFGRAGLLKNGTTQSRP